jgi:hypothetical protein
MLLMRKRQSAKRLPRDAFEPVRAVGLTFAGVEAATKYDGSPVLRVGGCFMAGLATHRSAEPDSLVVRVDPEARTWLLEEAPETYYVTEHYERHPVVLARLRRMDRDALRDLLAASWRLAVAKARTPRRRGETRPSAHAQHAARRLTR